MLSHPVAYIYFYNKIGKKLKVCATMCQENINLIVFSRCDRPE